MAVLHCPSSQGAKTEARAAGEGERDGEARAQEDGDRTLQPARVNVPHAQVRFDLFRFVSKCYVSICFELF